MHGAPSPDHPIRAHMQGTRTRNQKVWFIQNPGNLLRGEKLIKCLLDLAQIGGNCFSPCENECFLAKGQAPFKTSILLFKQLALPGQSVPGSICYRVVVFQFLIFWSFWLQLFEYLGLLIHTLGKIFNACSQLTMPQSPSNETWKETHLGTRTGYIATCQNFVAKQPA